MRTLNSATGRLQKLFNISNLSLRIKSAYPQGLETLRSLRHQNASSCEFEPSRSARKPRQNLCLSAVPRPGETGCERDEWSSERNRGTKFSGGRVAVRNADADGSGRIVQPFGLAGACRCKAAPAQRGAQPVRMPWSAPRAPPHRAAGRSAPSRRPPHPAPRRPRPSRAARLGCRRANAGGSRSG